MGDHRKMENVEQHLGNAMPTTLLHYQLTGMWRSPRGTVLRIEGLALVAIACSFFLVAFGSCRRWSNRWIIQKGFLVAQVLSLSLGTYSIGLMQSSSVKSEMYPIWAVSLLTLFGCVDPITTYIGLEYKGPLLKMIFQLCLYCGYVLLMSVSTISGGVGKLAIGVLTAITLIKGFHMSLALVLPSRTRDKIAGEFDYTETGALAGEGEKLDVDIHVQSGGIWTRLAETRITTMAAIHLSCEEMLSVLQLKDVTANGIEVVCLGYSLSNLLQRRFLGLDTAEEMELKSKDFERIGQAIDYKRTMKVIEVELAFLYEVFFTSNGFLHYQEAKTSSLWVFASFIGICFVGVATVIPGAIMSSRHLITGSNSPGTGTIVVDTTTADRIITLVILLSLALSQLVQLIRCWTSNWARVAFACEYARNKQASEESDPESCGQINSNSKEKQISWWMRLKKFMAESCEQTSSSSKEKQIRRWMRLKAFVVTGMNWFDKYLWQDKLGQYSLVDEEAASSRRKRRQSREDCDVCCGLLLVGAGTLCPCCLVCFLWTCEHLCQMLGLQYIGRVLRELLACDTSTPVRLHDDVKTSMADFLGKIKNRRIGVEWSSLFVDKGIDLDCLPYATAPLRMGVVTKSDAYSFAYRVMIWHIATRYCELADPQEESAAGGGGGGGSNDDTRKRNRCVAMALSRYCAYLVVSAPELLPGPSMEIKRAHKAAALYAQNINYWASPGTLLERMQQSSRIVSGNNDFGTGVYWGMRLLNERPPPPGCTPRRRSGDHWEVLALLWVQTLLYAAPYGDVQRHMQRLSQGGEFITHLWALLYHIGIDRWDREPAAQAAAEGTKEAAQVQGADVKHREPEAAAAAAAAETTQKMEAAQAAAGETREAAQVQGDLLAREAEIQEIV